MNKQLRLSRMERQAAARRPAGQDWRDEYGPAWQAKVMQRLTEALTEHGGPEGVEAWLGGMQERRGPSRGADWNELNEKLMTLSRLLWRDIQREAGIDPSKQNPSCPVEAG